MLAVLEDAVNVMRLYDKGHPLRIDAEAWVTSDDETWPFSYRNVCAAVSIPHDRLRRALLGGPALTGRPRTRETRSDNRMSTDIVHGRKYRSQYGSLRVAE